MTFTLRARVLAEFLGTGFLVAAVVGSGIMGERLAGGNVAIALLANTIATGAALLALILTFGPISGAHFNPAVTFAEAIENREWKELPAYVIAQCLGGVTGTAVAHLMFSLPWYSVSTHNRSGGALLLSEFIASFGLLSVIFGCSRLRPNSTALAVASYITSAYWFTASTSFANPAVTLARCFSNTFAGIRPQDAPGFIVMQLIGAAAAAWSFHRLSSQLSLSSKKAEINGGLPGNGEGVGLQTQRSKQP